MFHVNSLASSSCHLVFISNLSVKSKDLVSVLLESYAAHAPVFPVYSAISPPTTKYTYLRF